MKSIYKFILPAILVLLLGSACRTDFDVYAPEKDVYSVYGILDAHDSVQYIRVGKAFQVDGDAYEYASANDLSREGVNLKLIGNNHTYQATEVTDLPKDSTGIWLPDQVIYKIVTDGTPGNPALVRGGVYDLKIAEGNQENYVTATTVIPEEPGVKDPESPFRSGGNLWEVRKINLAGRFKMEWLHLDPASACSERELSYEVRVGLRYQENGEDKLVEYGPTNPNKCNDGCTGSQTRICYQFGEKEIVGAWRDQMADPNSNLLEYDNTPITSFDSTALPRPAYLKVTVMDQNLSRYLEVNNPLISDLTGVRPEFTNINSDEVITVGVFGAKTSAMKFYTLTACTEHLLGLNGTAATPGCSW